jgi:hypothetical protein
MIITFKTSGQSIVFDALERKNSSAYFGLKEVCQLKG